MQGGGKGRLDGGSGGRAVLRNEQQRTHNQRPEEQPLQHEQRQPAVSPASHRPHTPRGRNPPGPQPPGSTRSLGSAAFLLRCAFQTPRAAPGSLASHSNQDPTFRDERPSTTSTAPSEEEGWHAQPAHVGAVAQFAHPKFAVAALPPPLNASRSWPSVPPVLRKGGGELSGDERLGHTPQDREQQEADDGEQRSGGRHGILQPGQCRGAGRGGEGWGGAGHKGDSPNIKWFRGGWTEGLRGRYLLRGAA
jgi:hypothetical protein